MAYEEYDYYNEPSTGSLKESLYEILNGLRNPQKLRETSEGISRVRQALPGVTESVGRGAIAAVPGSIGDISDFARTYAPEVMEKKFGKERFFPTTREILDYVPRMTPTHEGATTLEDVGAAISPGVGGVARDVALLGKGLPIGMSIKDVSAAAKPYSVSTRVPTAVKATEDALKEDLFSNYKAFRSDQNAFTHNVGLLKDYPNLALRSKNADINAEKFVEHVKNNLLYLHDQVPADTRARSKLWYEGANKIANNMSKEYGISEPAASGILAVLSPQKDWFMNVSLGERVASTLAHKQGFKWDSAMSDVANEIYGKPQYKPLLDAISGKRLEELKDPVEKAMWIRTHDQAHNPREHFIVTPEGDFSGIRTKANGEPFKTGWGSNNEIAKAVSIFDNPTRENIHSRLGGEHKVRNFYMNIYDPHNPHGHTTIDTHAVAAGLLRPLSGNTREVSHNFGSNYPGEVGPKNSAFTGKGGTYGLYHEGYQRAAKERGTLPREMQSITWEAVRGLFPDTFKNEKNVKEIEDIWKKHKSGKIDIDETRKQILEKAGGINEPEWKQ
jgi:hypothetical protein